MVASTFAKNFGNSVKTRPPLVVFTICLMGIIVTTLSLAYYVHTKDKILNSDVKQEWLSLLKYFNKMSVCLENDNDPTRLQINEGTMTIASKATLNIEGLKQPINVQGRVPLKGWSSPCPEETHIPDYLYVSFSILNPNNTKDICVTLTGPATFMPKLLNDYKICEPFVKQGAEWDSLVASVESQSCINGLAGKLVFDVEAYKGVKFDAVLSMEDRLVINYHLILTSSVLLFAVVCITLYALCRKKNSTNVGDSTQYLMARSI